jgi:hypothetical protein
VRRWVWDADMRRALAADEMGLGKTFTLVATAMICKLLNEKGAIGLLLSTLWGNTLAEWVIIVQNDFPGIIGKERDWYPHQRLNCVPHHLLEIKTTLPHGHPSLISPRKAILVVKMPRDGETSKTVIDKITHGTNFKLVNLLNGENVNLTHEEVNTSIDEQGNRWTIHLVLYDTLTSRAKPPSNGRYSHSGWSVGIFDVSHWYETKIAWAVELRQMWELDSTFESLQRRDSLHSLPGVVRQFGCFQVHLKIRSTRR